jgi:Kef-type K+ transport system membrane component KefB
LAVQFGGLLALAVAAFVAPLLARLMPRRLVPPVVVEVLAGVALGPQGLGLVHATGGVYVLYLLGFGFLLFLAGQEVAVGRFREPTFKITAASFVASLVLAFPLAFGLSQIASGADVRLLALAMTASSVGVIVPVLSDAHEIDSEFGQLTIMAGSVGEFGALLLLTVLFSAQPEPTWAQAAYVVALGVAAVIGAVGLRRLWRSPWLRRELLATDQSTSQLRVRGAFVILLAFTGLAHEFGVDALLGAFVGGVVLNVADTDDRSNREEFRGKLHAIGYGFLVPVFFIVTGVHFDVRSLFASVSAVALLPALVACIMLARVAPAWLYRRTIGNKPAVAAGLLQATTLTFPVVVAEVGRSLHLLSAATAAALVAAALVSVLLFPAAALALQPWTQTANADPGATTR